MPAERCMALQGDRCTLTAVSSCALYQRSSCSKALHGLTIQLIKHREGLHKVGGLHGLQLGLAQSFYDVLHGGATCSQQRMHCS